MPLKPSVGQVDCAIAYRLVEIAPPDQSEIDHVTGEFQQQPFRRVVLPVPHPSVRKPERAPVLEPKLQRRCRLTVSPQVSESPFRRLGVLSITFLALQDSG